MSTFIDLANSLHLADIAINAIGGFLGSATLLWLAMGTQGIRTLRSRFRRPSVMLQARKTPKNIFTGIELGAPAEWIKEQLGQPNKIAENWWGYRFSDSLVSLTFDANHSLLTLAVALTDEKTTFEFPALHFDCPPLGKMVVADLQVDHLSLTFNDSTRHSELVITGSEGPRGAFHHIAFGVLNPHIPGPLLIDDDFQWDRNEAVLITPADKLKINWAAVSATSEIVTFPWDLGLRL
ncbi:hypothetical protein SAMN04490179_5096 [Pseudomonas antarctica]|uniref:Uncharacterized protein n=1 Tax=Pseudomonas antarctica TaxID=219572 RepID=A0A1H0CVM8_9PSED|nr:hypothetical protein [Pseudomonas antarctica]KAF2406186.1 hypothetical protein PSAN_54110 [Pseudomonas antarctica]SDN61924.1 hypothetical protein SAMN04490179_5096 [Pseudomonas antarctica]